MSQWANEFRPSRDSSKIQRRGAQSATEEATFACRASIVRLPGVARAAAITKPLAARQEKSADVRLNFRLAGHLDTIYSRNMSLAMGYERHGTEIKILIRFQRIGQELQRTRQRREA